MAGFAFIPGEVIVVAWPSANGCQFTLDFNFVFRLNLDDNDDDDDAEWAVKGVTNVSKAFRRLEAYAEWMEDTGTELTEPALIWDDDMAAVHRTWAMSTSVAQNGELVWWIDMGGIDMENHEESQNRTQNS